jgi:hypothetical protein
MIMAGDRQTFDLPALNNLRRPTTTSAMTGAYSQMGRCRSPTLLLRDEEAVRKRSPKRGFNRLLRTGPGLQRRAGVEVALRQHGNLLTGCQFECVEVPRRRSPDLGGGTDQQDRLAIRCERG